MSYFAVNDNLGVIIDLGYLNLVKDRDKILKGSRKVEDPNYFNSEDISDEPHMVVAKGCQRKLACLFDDGLQMFYPVIGTFPNHEKEERKLSIKIAKANVAIDPKNKYYCEILRKLEGR